METDAIKRILEAALLAAGRPLSLNDLEGLFTGDVDAPPRDAIRAALAELSEDWRGRSLTLQEVASGYRAQVREEFEPWLARLWDEKPARYSRALLETLAIIAYRQPITRSEIEDIRGVSVSTQIMRTLTEREWVRVVGQRDAPGRPAMYGTTRAFLDHFNLKTLDQLPELSELNDVSGEHPELAFEGEPETGGAETPEGEKGAPDETTPGDDGSGEGAAEPGEHEMADAESADADARSVEVGLARVDETEADDAAAKTAVEEADAQAALADAGAHVEQADAPVEQADAPSVGGDTRPDEDGDGDPGDPDEESAAKDAGDGSCTHVS